MKAFCSKRPSILIGPFGSAACSSVKAQHTHTHAHTGGPAPLGPPNDGFAQVHYYQPLLLTIIINHYYQPLLLTIIIDHYYEPLLLTIIIDHYYQPLLLTIITNHYYRPLLSTIIINHYYYTRTHWRLHVQGHWRSTLCRTCPGPGHRTCRSPKC